MASVSADAPVNGEEYIFNCRPITQPTITQRRLNKWYVNLFDKAENQGVVHGITYNRNPDSSLCVSLCIKA